MAQGFPAKMCYVLLFISVLCLTVPEVQAKPPKHRQTQSEQSLTAAQAATRAKANYGGTVLKVTPRGQGFRVKLLTDSGRVMTVMVKG